MIKFDEIQKRIAAKPERSDIKTCLRESFSMARGQDPLKSINFLALAIFGILKIKDLTRPEKNAFRDNILKTLGSMDLMPLVKEATQGQDSLISFYEEKGMKELFIRLQQLSKEIKQLEKQALIDKAQAQEDAIKQNLEAIRRELDKGNIRAAKNKADRMLETTSEKKAKFLEEIINIFEEKESLKGWWYYLQKRYNPEGCNLDEARYCATKVAKIRSLDDPDNEKSWYRNNLDYRRKVWELTPKGDGADIDPIVEACYNLAICVYYYIEKIDGMTPKGFGRELIQEGLKYAPDSKHLKKMGKTFGVGR